MDLPFLDASEIIRDKHRWRRISRGDAVHACRNYPVVVVHRIQSRDAAAWMDPSNRFFKSDGPYLYDGLRYFAFVGGDYQKVKSAGQLAPKPELEELEPLEVMDLSGEMMNMGSPALKKPAVPGVPKPPSLPAVPEVPDVPGIPDIPSLDIPTLPEIPEIPEIPSIPEIPTLPEIPAIPELAIPELPGIPEIPGIPQVPEIPGLPAIPDIPVLPVIDLELANAPLIPIEYRLLDGKGNPLPPTQFKVTLPDGTVKTGKSDAEGFIRIPDNKQKGQAKLELLDPSENDPERIAAFAAPVAKGKQPIEIKLTDSEDKVLPDMAFRLKLPDGSVKEGKSDKDGFIRFPDNEQQGQMELVLTAFTKKET